MAAEQLIADYSLNISPTGLIRSVDLFDENRTLLIDSVDACGKKSKDWGTVLREKHRDLFERIDKSGEVSRLN